MGLRGPVPAQRFSFFPNRKSKTCCVVLQLGKLRNIFKLSALPSVLEKTLFSLFLAKKDYPLNICSHIWLHVQDFFFSKNK